MPERGAPHTQNPASSPPNSPSAARAAGIHKATYYSWMTRGEKAAEALSKGDAIDDEEAAFADFFSRVSQAEAIAEADAVAAVRAADKGWQAHMTYLERRFSSRWRQQTGTRYVDSDKRPTIEDFVDRMEREGKIDRGHGVGAQPRVA